MFKLVLDAGHGINTAGKRCDKKLDPKQTREWSLNSRICTKIEELLKAYDGYDLLRVDDETGKTDVALNTRSRTANKFNADFYLSIHHNAGINRGKGGGVVAYVYPNVGTDTTSWQKELYNAVIQYTGLKGNRSNPLAKKNLHVLRETLMPAVLLECGFMDSATDVPIILTENFADGVAKACVEVIVKKGNLTKKKAEQPKVEQPAETKEPTPVESIYFKKYTGKTSSIVDGLKAVGATSTYDYRKKIAKANGISLYIGSASQNGKLLSLLKQGKLIKP